MVVESKTRNMFIAIMNYEVWEYISERLKISPERKMQIFLIAVVLLSLLLEIIIGGWAENLPESVNGFSLTISTILWMIGIMMNPKPFYKIDNVYVWEIIIGILMVLSAFTIVTPIKHVYYPGTRDFGVLNGGIVLLGVFVIFYGIKNYKLSIPYILIYLIFIILNLLWNVLGSSVVGRYLAKVSSYVAYQVLRSIGYNVSLNGTTISIVTINGGIISATIAGLCSGVEGITFSIVVLVLLFIGSSVNYKWRIITILIASLIMFLLNILRIVFIFIFAYYYGQEGLKEAHAWLGNVIFLLFILSYWYLIDKKMNIERDEKCNSSQSSN